MNIQWYIYQHSTYLRLHKPSYVKTLIILLLVSFLPHAHNTQALFWQFCIIGGSCHKCHFVVTKVLSWQRQKMCFCRNKHMFVATKPLLWQKWYLWQLPPKIVLWYLMVCVCMCVERDYWERKMCVCVWGGVGAHPPTHSHTTTFFGVINLEANYYNKTINTFSWSSD